MIIRLLYLLLMLSCIFDSSDLILGLKVPIFALLVLFSVLSGKFSFNNSGLFSYIFIFSILLPIVSFCIGYLSNGEHYLEPSLFGAIKPYLFLFLSFILIKDKKLLDDVVVIFAYSLFALSITILIVLLMYIVEIVPGPVLNEFGDQYVLFAAGEREFGVFSMTRVYFHSSPMLVFALCYFLEQFIKKKNKWPLVVSIIITASLALSGTRNNMIMAFVPYMALYYIQGSKKTRFRIIIIGAILMLYVLSQEFVMALFDKTETSNSTKLSYLDDYSKAFSNIRTIVLGDGLDSYFYTKHRGMVNNTELTYFELFRRFGLFGGLTYLYLMIKPARRLIKKGRYQWLGLAYTMYLVMIFSNPFFFSSNGMAILSIVLAVYFQNSQKSIKPQIEQPNESNKEYSTC